MPHVNPFFPSHFNFSSHTREHHCFPTGPHSQSRPSTSIGQRISNLNKSTFTLRRCFEYLQWISLFRPLTSLYMNPPPPSLPRLWSVSVMKLPGVDLCVAPSQAAPAAGSKDVLLRTDGKTVSSREMPHVPALDATWLRNVSARCDFGMLPPPAHSK